MYQYKNKDEADFVARKLRQNLCVSTNVTVDPDTDDEGELVHSVNMKGCGNSRRIASKWCQQCSDDYHNKKKDNG